MSRDGRERGWIGRAVAPLVCAAVALGACSPERREVSGWRSAAPAPVKRVEAASAVVDGKLYVFGGFHKNRGLRALRRVDVYDPARDAWRRLTDMPIADTHIVAAMDGDTIWLAGGYEGDDPGRAIARVVRYHVKADRWSEGPPLPAARAGGFLIRHERNLHYFGGFSYDRDTTYGEHWVLPLDAPDAWLPRAPLPEPRGHLSAALLNGEIYAIGGQFNHDVGRRDVTFVHAYDPGTDRWREVAPLPSGRSHAELSTLVLAGKIHVFGGRCTPGCAPKDEETAGALRDGVVYDPGKDRWEPGDELPMPLLGAVVAAVDGHLVLTAGSDYRSQRPRNETWTRPLRGE